MQCPCVYFYILNVAVLVSIIGTVHGIGTGSRNLKLQSKAYKSNVKQDYFLVAWEKGKGKKELCFLEVLVLPL